MKVIPFRESLEDYVLINTEIMSNAIEDNLGTLESISKSEYAAHVRNQIAELVAMLKKMLNHLDILVQAQQYWVTLDPVYNSGLFKNFFENKTDKFLEVRTSFRRIMWSSYRNPSACYNLMIEDRIPTFEAMVDFYSQL